MKIRSALKKVFTLKRVMIAVSVIAVLAVIATPICLRHLQYSRNKAAQDLLKQIALVEMAIEPACCVSGACPPYYVYTDGIDESAEESVERLVQSGSFFPRGTGSRPKYLFLPDGSVAFRIMRLGAINGVTPIGFVAFAGHNSIGSTVYTYNNIDTIGIVEAREGVEYGGITATSSVAPLFRYKYDPSTKTVEWLPGEVKFGPDPKDAKPARMVVNVAAD